MRKIYSFTPIPHDTQYCSLYADEEQKHAILINEEAMINENENYLKWISEHINGKWFLQYYFDYDDSIQYRFSFANAEDAVLFRLRF